MHRGRLLAVVFLLGIAPAHAERLDVRALPTAVELWRWKGSTQSLLAGPELLFVAGKGRISALDPRDGKLAWTTVIGTEAEDCGCGHGAHVQVEDRLFVPIAESVAVLDTDQGVLLERLHLGGTVHRVLGPPVLAQGDGDTHSTLVRLDERSGAEVARLELPRVESLERFGDRFTAEIETPGEGDGGTAGSRLVLGLDDRLQVVWRLRLPALSSVERDGDRLVVGERAGERVRRPLDPRTGELGAALRPEEGPREGPGTLACADGTDGPAFNVQITTRSADGQRTSSVARPGKDGWSASLPGQPQECARWGEHLVLRLGVGTSRDLLAVLRQKSGERENLVLLPPSVGSLVLARGRVVLETEESLMGIDPLDAGLPEAQTRSLADSVADILARGAQVGYADTIATELDSLGPEALPLAVAALPRLDGEPLLAVAKLAVQHAYSPAAAPLAAALDRARAAAASGSTPGDRERDEAPRMETELAEAVMALAGPAEVPTVARYAAREWAEVCRSAMAALGRIGTPEALGALDRALAAARPPAGPWLRPPAPPKSGALSPAQALAAMTRPLPPADLGTAARSVEVVVGKRRLLVFPGDAYGGSGDLWITETATSGREAPVYFLGHLDGCATIAARVQEDALEVRCGPPLSAPADADASSPPPSAAGPPQPLRVRLDAWQVDSDGDGLTDLLERHLGLDPARADTNGDGVPDGLDRHPNSTQRPRSSADELALAAMETSFACRGSRGPASPVLFLTGVAPLAWRGRDGATITLSAADLARRQPGSTSPLLQIDVDGEVPTRHSRSAPPPLRSGERRVVVRVLGTGGGGDENAWGELMDLRRVGDRWVVTRDERWFDFAFDAEE